MVFHWAGRLIVHRLRSVPYMSRGFDRKSLCTISRGFGSVTYYSCMLNRAGATGRGSNAIYVEEMALRMQIAAQLRPIRMYMMEVCDAKWDLAMSNPRRRVLSVERAY